MGFAHNLGRVGLRAVGGLAITLAGLATATAAFSLFLLVQGHNPLAVFGNIWLAAFGSGFSWSNTLTKAAPLMLTALCTAIPARVGLVIIGNEGALLVGGLGAAAVAPALDGGVSTLVVSLLVGAMVGACWILLSGLLRQVRGVNETISSLLLYYVGAALFLFLVEGPLRDPGSLNKPSTPPVPDGAMLGSLTVVDVHYGLVFGIIACIILAFWLQWTPSGFAARIIGGNERAAQVIGLPRNRIILMVCAIGGACAGLAGAIEVLAVHQAANSALQAGLGFSGILVAFTARHRPLHILWVAVLFGGLEASSGLLQRRHDLPDASTAVFQGLIFVSILAFETLRGRDWQALFKRRAPAATT